MSAQSSEAAARALDRSLASIDRFINSVWIEDGLSDNTLAAYRRDLTGYSQWLAQAQQRALDETRESDLRERAVAAHADSKTSTANRRLTVFKRYFRWALREGVLTIDPTLRLLSAKPAQRLPKTLSESQVEALLAAPDVGVA
ncbi:MAG: site-specific tyrosine recombinase XerD, partial [Marmoricola sp.]|nr:site-specific tyrosine recombinase XerD [Marmoricola sp.]